ncbi:uncharacterized protein LOC111276144 [Durio zibethinus]|uniref:Uncharacterized protein LOC111276144 n=1 Tax=Durio zibethinus TaxID=66656 RepID=A0A6P5WNH7_DURZI|nr:uncharacterized protein LOC111276144 [Durio zibethinus]
MSPYHVERSRNSMSRSSLVSVYDDQSPEESSWTMYFEDFSNNNNVHMNESSSFSSDMNYQTSSLVSDAASSAARRHVFGASLDHKSYNSLSFRKRKTKGSAGLVNDDLEDTASSPANSPEVCNLVNHFDKNLKQKDAKEMSQEKGGASGQIDERNGDELGFNGRENDGTELKKKGLCLVPLSMVVHYLG